MTHGSLMGSYSYDRTHTVATLNTHNGKKPMSYDRRLARTVPFGKNDVDRLRKDVLLLLKNVERVTEDRSFTIDQQDAYSKRYDEFKQKYNDFREEMVKWGKFYDQRIYKELVPNITIAVRLWLTGSEKYPDSPYIAEQERQWTESWEKKIRTDAWDLYISLGPPMIGHWEGEKKKWAEKVKRAARKAWAILTEWLEWLGSRNVVPVRNERSVEIVHMEGFNITVVGYEEGDEYHEKSMKVFREALKLYKSRVSRVFPELAHRQIPMQFRYDCKLDLGGEHLGDHIDICASPNLKPLDFVKTMAHEMGHNLYRTLSSDQQHFWTKALHRDLGDLDLHDLLKVMKDGESVWDVMERTENSDPVLALQLQGVLYGYNRHQLKSEWRSKEELEKYLANGGDPLWTVPKTPISGYASKNEEEAFCEVIGMAVAFGANTIDPMVRGWFQTILPGQIRFATTYRR